MKHETLVFDVFKMVLTSAVYLALSVSVWIFLRLVYTCFAFPKVMKNLERGLNKKIDQMKRDEDSEKKPLGNIGEENLNDVGDGLDESDAKCKKNK